MRREKLDWEREGKRGLVAFSFSINFLYFFYISILLVRDKPKKKTIVFNLHGQCHENLDLFLLLTC